MPKVSVWLTSYNHGQFISESIEGILGQTYKDFELYIIDDCSSDNSWDIIQEYATKDSRIIAIRHPYNQGDSGMYSMLEQLQGEYLAIAHCDDAWLPDKLEKQVKILDDKKDVAACFTWVSVIGDDGKEFDDGKHPYSKVFEQENRTRCEWLNHFFYKSNCLCHPSLLIRRTAYKEFNLITKGYNGLPDFCKWIRLCKNREIYIIQERLTKFRVHTDGSNTSGENSKSICRLNTEEWFILREYEELIEKNEVVNVFPEVEKYFVDGEISQKFALAQLMLECDRSSYKLYGLQLLFDLFQNEEETELVSRLYGYTKKNYNLDKQKYDVFNAIPDNRYLKVNVYLNCDGTYEENQKIEVVGFVQQTGFFSIKINLQDYSLEKLDKLRVDLDENRYRKFQICKCSCDNRVYEMYPTNGIKEGEWDLFYTLDPQYQLCLENNGYLCIEGYTDEIPNGQVEKYFVELKQRCSVLEEQMAKIKGTPIWKAGMAFKRLLKK